MNSTANGSPVVPRTGYIVEFNALWYNALCFAASLSELSGNNAQVDHLNKLAEKVKTSFVEVFLKAIFQTPFLLYHPLIPL